MPSLTIPAFPLTMAEKPTQLYSCGAEGENCPKTVPFQSTESEYNSVLLVAAIFCILSLCIITIVVSYVHFCWNYSNTLRQARRHRRRSRRISRARRFSWRAAEVYFSTSATEGLGRDMIDALPVFLYKPENFKDGLCCSVCLCEFEENDKGRLLPTCNHSFHVDCLDMWLYSHSTCPLCRASVEKQFHQQVEVSTGKEVNDKEVVNSRSASGAAVQVEGVDNGEEGMKVEEQGGVAIDID